MQKLRTNHADALRGDQIRLGSEITLLAEKESLQLRERRSRISPPSALKRRVGEVFTRRLRELDPEGKRIARRRSQELATTGSRAQRIRSARRPEAAIQNAFNETFSAVVRIKFEDSQDTICGIELTANARRLRGASRAISQS